VTIEPDRLTAFLESRDGLRVAPNGRKTVLDPRRWDWLVPPVYDITGETRVQAKLAYYGALAEPLPRESTTRANE
jgi:hypothetical protein